MSEAGDADLPGGDAWGDRDVVEKTPATRQVGREHGDRFKGLDQHRTHVVGGADAVQALVEVTGQHQGSLDGLSRENVWQRIQVPQVVLPASAVSPTGVDMRIAPGDADADHSHVTDRRAGGCRYESARW